MAKDMVATVTEQQKSKKRKDKLPRTTPPPLSPPPPPKKTHVGRVHKQTAKQASIVASNATAKSLFAETDQLRKLQEEVTMLRNQLDRKDQVLYGYLTYGTAQSQRRTRSSMICSPLECSILYTRYPTGITRTIICAHRGINHSIVTYSMLLAHDNPMRA